MGSGDQRYVARTESEYDALVNLHAYLLRRRTFEVALAVGLIAVSAIANAVVVHFDFARNDAPFPAWLPWGLELTSHVAVALLIPLIIAFDRRFPLTLGTWRRSAPAHAGFSVVFSLAHVTLFYWMRRVIWPRMPGGEDYYWPDWLAEFGYEYLKDFRTYLLVIALLYLYRFVLVRLQGEAGYVADGETADTPSTALPERFLVKKLGKEFLVRVADIDWIEANGNYVNLYVGPRAYPLRETMNGIAERLASGGFARCHRRAIVNLERVAEIEVFDSGDGELRLTTDTRVPVSRRYRRALTPRLG